MAVAAAVLLVTLGLATSTVAQELPPGGYYADGAYYVPSNPAAPAPAGSAPPACPPGYGVPTLYVARTATAVMLQWVPPVGGNAPGFPYVPVYGSEVRC
jgi:hypothetical protein